MPETILTGLALLNVYRDINVDVASNVIAGFSKTKRKKGFCIIVVDINVYNIRINIQYFSIVFFYYLFINESVFFSIVG